MFIDNRQTGFTIKLEMLIITYLQIKIVGRK